MNNNNLVPISSRTAREIKQMGKKGAIRSNEVQRKNKEEKQKKQKLFDTLINILSSKVTSKGIKNKLKKFGIDGDDYFTAMCVFAIIVASSLRAFSRASIMILVCLSADNLFSSSAAN